MNVDHPLHFDGRGRTADTGDDDHVRDLIEQVLFTVPGERVNRPTFGTGLLELVFAPNGEALAAAAQFSIQGALQLWLGDVIEVQGVDVAAEDEQLHIAVRYRVRRTQQASVADFTRPLAQP